MADEIPRQDVITFCQTGTELEAGFDAAISPPQVFSSSSSSTLASFSASSTSSSVAEAHSTVAEIPVPAASAVSSSGKVRKLKEKSDSAAGDIALRLQ